MQLFSRDSQQTDQEYLLILYSTNTQIEQALIRRLLSANAAFARMLGYAGSGEAVA